MGQKQKVTVDRPRASSEVHGEPEPDRQLARGSASMVTSEQLMRVSQPRMKSSAPLSAFQLPEAQRQSERELTTPRPVEGSERPYLFAIVALLFCAVAVLAYLALI